MITVALETSVRRASVAVRVEGKVATSTLEEERAHASDLLPRLADLLETRGASPGDVGLVVVGRGPGSYTGLRVGIATALGLARGADASMVGLPSVEVLAYAELEVGEEGVVLLDARGGALYFARYRRVEGGIEVVQAPCALTPEQALEALPAGGVVFGDASAAEAVGLDRARLREGALPRADVLLELGERLCETAGGMSAAELAPLYLRPFVARSRRR